MSTYLVAFVVCDFKNNSDGNVGVWARADAVKSTDYALSIAPKVLKFLEGFFGVKYPLPKTDLIAIPDFAFGAMVSWKSMLKYFENDILLHNLQENFGLITFRETAMLYDVRFEAKVEIKFLIKNKLSHLIFRKEFQRSVKK
jgi:aminopeptidase N